MPWKNGFGVTAEIDRSPQEGETYDWRLSRATVSADGPFSAFHGYDRWLMILDGEGAFLDGEKLEPFKPFRFSGDVARFCRLIAGPVTDLGLIFDRRKIEAEMKYVEGKFTPPASSDFLSQYVYDLESGDTAKDGEPAAGRITRGVWIGLKNRA